MKLRVRTIDGGTLKVECEKTQSVAGFIASLELPEAIAAAPADFHLSLNKKDLLHPESTLEANGICAGDLVHLVSRTGATGGTGSVRVSTSVVARGAGSVGAATCASAQPLPRSSLFGLPTAAPTSDVAHNDSASTGRLIQDASGRVWESVETAPGPPSASAMTISVSGSGGEEVGRVSGTAARKQDAEEARLQRLHAIERRFGKTFGEGRDQGSDTQKRERPAAAEGKS